MSNKAGIRIKPSLIVLLADIALSFFGLLSSIWLYKSIVPNTSFSVMFTCIYTVITLVYTVVLFNLLGTNKKITRFFLTRDYLHFIIAIGGVYLLSFITALVFFYNAAVVYKGVAVIGFFITCVYALVGRLFIGEIRMFIKKQKLQQPGRKKLLIYGAGEIGWILKNAIGISTTYQLAGFLDDDVKKVDRLMGTVPVYNAGHNVRETIIKTGASEIIIATHKISPQRKEEFFKQISGIPLNVREIASVRSLFEPNFNINNFSVIDISKLIQREPIQLYNEYVEETLNGKKVLVTGAAGSIGSEIVRKLADHNAGLIICIDFAESALYDLQQEMLQKFPYVGFKFILADVRDEDTMYDVFNSYNPHFIYHAASYKHVPLMEQFPWLAVQTNVFATAMLARLAVQFKVEKFVFISTDKAVKPTSVMGATKRLAEIIIQAYSSGVNSSSFAITRFGNVLGSNGSVVPLFRKQIEWGGPVTVTHPEMTRFFMTIAEACQLVLEASVMAEGGEIFLFDMGEPFKIVDLARNMIKMSGYIPDVNMHIKFIGQRPGEKMYEELFLETEKMQKTYHEKIMISKEAPRDFAEVKKVLFKLEEINGFYEPGLVKKIIKELVPEYKFDLQEKLVSVL